MARLLLKGGRIVDPANGVDKKADLLIEDGKIRAIAENLAVADAPTLDVSGKVVAPGLIDVHAHLRDPGFTEREDIRSGTMAAAAGGFTTVLAMPNTNPVCDDPAVVAYVLAKGRREGVVNVLPIAAITKGERGEEVVPMAELVAAGAVAFSDDGQPIMNAGVMRRALLAGKEVDKVLAVHCEDRNISGEGVIAAGEVAQRLGLPGIPYTSEAVMVARDLLLAEETGAKLHICHVSRARSAELIREAKRRGVKVTAEVVFHYLNTTVEDIVPFDGRFKVKPPFGNRQDLEALKEALADGTIEVIATDHAPHTEAEKERDFRTQAPFGLVGLETALGVVLTELVHGKVLSLSDTLATMTCNPARIFGLDKGTLGVGKDADIVVIDLDREWVVDAGAFYSKGRNCPQNGRVLKGKAVLTVVGGRVVMRDGQIVA